MNTISRQSGVAVWRQIADRLRSAIGDGTFDADSPLPGEIALAGQFGVNRHTVRAALSALVEDGVLRREKGRGTFVVKGERLSYPIGIRTRFSDGLQGQAKSLGGTLIGSRNEDATAEVAEALEIEPGAAVIRMETVSQADGEPLSRSTSWFDASRFPRIDVAFRETGSITAALKIFGVDDYLRKTTAITATVANAADRTDLDLPPGSIVLVARALNIDTDNRPIQYAITRFVADRVELLIQPDAG